MGVFLRRFNLSCVIAALGLVVFAATSRAQTITEIIDAAGDGAGNALDSPSGIAVDGSGNVFVGGGGTDNAFKVTPGGMISQVIDATGDGVGHVLNGTGDIAVDVSGNCYVVGYVTANAFKITPEGVITQIIDYHGDGAAHPLYEPCGIAVDVSGNVYVTGRVENVAFKITPGGVITAIIDSTGDGGGNALEDPERIAVDGSGNVYVTGGYSENAFKITPGGVITQIIDATGDGGGNTLDNPLGIAVDGSGNVFVAGAGSNNAFKITPGGVIIEIIDATGDGSGNPLVAPNDVAVDGSGDVYVSAANSDNAFKITPGGAITEIVDATGDGGGNILDRPSGVATDVAGTVYVVGVGSDNAFKVEPPPPPAPPGALGEEFQVNTFTTGSQGYPSVGVDARGGFVVVWESWLQDGSHLGVFGQRFDCSGSRLGGEFQVNTYTTNGQQYPSVAVGADGDFVVVWESLEQDGGSDSVQGQRYDSSGNRVGGEFQVNTSSPSGAIRPAVVRFADGGFVVVWSGSEVQGQRFDSGGIKVGGEFQVNSSAAGYQLSPSVATDSDGAFVVVWNSWNDYAVPPHGARGQRYDSGGNPAGGEFDVCSGSGWTERTSEVAMGPSGEFVVVWYWGFDSYATTSVHGEQFNSNGNPVGDCFQVNTHNTSNQTAPSVAKDGDGGFVVVWRSWGQDGSELSVHGQRFDPAGDRVGEEFQVNTYTPYSQSLPVVAMGVDGNFVVVWQSDGQDGSDWGVHGQRFGVDSGVFADGFESGDTSAWSAAIQ